MLKQRCNAFREVQYSARDDGDLLAAPEGDYARLRGPRWDVVANGLADLRLESSWKMELEEWTGPSGIAFPATRKVPRMGTRVEFARQHQSPTEKIASVPASWRIQEPASGSYSPVRSDLSQRRDHSGVVPEDQPFHCLPASGSHRALPSAAAPTTDCASNDLTRLQQPSAPHSKGVRTSQMCQTDDEGEYESLIPFASNRLPGPIVPCRCRRCTQQPPTKISPSLRPVNPDARSPLDTKPDDVQTKTQVVPGTTKTTTTTNSGGVVQEHEWVVKRRADGSRYITRRPVRKRLLKERARRVEEERACLTTTTEEDGGTGMTRTDHRQGTRDDRRRHAERSRARRRERESAAVRDKTGERGPGTCVGGVDDDNEGPDIVQLSRKKMLKCKGKRVLDDFTTLQELLAHGSRDPHQGRGFNHLLSVTTV